MTLICGLAAPAAAQSWTLTVTPGDKQLTVEWTKHPRASFGYQVEYRPGASGRWSGTSSFGPNTLSHIITGLTNGQLYQVRVDAQELGSIDIFDFQNIDDIQSIIFNATPVAPQAPSKPGTPTLTPGNTQLTVSWTEPATNGAAITDYDVQYKLSTADPSAFAEWNASDDSTTIGATITGLANGLSYDVRVRATNSVGNSPWSDAAIATPVAQPPSRPALPTLIPGNSQLTVSWTEPANNGGAITDYDVKYKRTSVNSWTEWNAGDTSTTRSATITGLANGTSYDVQVRARNSGGTSMWSKSASAAPAAAPAAPLAPALTPGNTQLTVSWTEPATNGGAITDYDVRYRPVTDPVSSWTEWNDTDTSTTIGAIITGLANGLSYDVQVRATNSVGDSDWSDATSAMPVVPQAPSKPGAPTLVAGNTQISVTWTAPPANGATIISYDVRYKLASEILWTYFVDLFTTTDMTIDGLVNGQDYEVQVQAQNSAGDGPWSDSATDMPALQVPSKPAAPAVTPGDGELAMSWMAPAANGASISDYDVHYRPVTRPERPWAQWNASDDSTTRSATITGLDNGQSYEVQVRATNSVGDSDWSDATSATPLGVPSKPGAPTLVAGNTQISVTWTAPAANGALITDYDVRYKLSTAGSNAFVEWNASDDSTTRSATITGLVNGQSYDVQVRATNSASAGDGPWSDSASKAPTDQVPVAPGRPTLTVGNEQLGVTWTAPAVNSDPITDYDVRYRPVTDPVSSWTEWKAGDTSVTIGVTITGLANGQNYEVQVRAHNSAGHGPWSASDSASPSDSAVQAPSKPLVPTVTPGDGQLAVSWMEPDANGDRITGYEVEYKLSSETGWSNHRPGGRSRRFAVRGGTSTTITGLDNGQRYDVRVRAENRIGSSHWSESSVGAVPTVRIDDSVVSVGRSNCVTPPAPRVTEDEITVIAQGARDKFPTARGTATGGPFTPQLSTSSTYGNFEVNADGNWVYTLDNDKSEVQGLTHNQVECRAFPIQPSGGGSPTNIHITVIGVNDVPTGVTVDWVTPAADGASGEIREDTSTTVRVEVADLTAEDADIGDTHTFAMHSVSTTDAGSFEVDVSKLYLKAGTVLDRATKASYVIKLRATDSNLATDTSNKEETLTVTPPPPAQPTGFAAAPRHQSVYLAWTDPSDSSITGWEVRYKVKTGSYGDWTAIPGSQADTTSHTVPNLTNGTEYTFQVRAVNLIGDGAPSAALDATPAPVPAQPTGFTATPGDTQVALAWTDPSDSTITGWEVRYKVETAADYGDWTAILNSQADTTSHTVPNLTNGTEYTFQVRAVNLIGDGTPSAALDATPAPVPAQPTGFTATPGDTQVALAWTDPSDSTITGWEVRYKVETAADYGDWTAILNSQADTTSHTVPNLTNGTEYTFQVRAVNLIGDGAPSAALDATPAPVPAQPTGFTAAPGDTQVALAWTDPSDSSITGWEVRYKVETAADYGDWTAILNSQADTTSHTVPNLTNGTEYTFQVRAVNLIGDGTPSAALDATPAPVPAQPTGFTAAPGDTQVALAWTDPSDSTITGWEVRYKVETAADYGDWTAILNSQADTTSHTVPNLTNGTEYTFQVRAVNLIGDGAPSAALDATPAPVPAQPTGFTAAPGDTQVALAWTDPSDSSITGWEVRYKVKTAADYGDWTAILNSQADTTSHTVPNLTNGTEYTFQVRAVNLIGDGTPSAALDATPAPVPAQPTGFTATPGDTQVALAWTDPSDSSITGWEVRYKVETAADYGDWTAILNSQADTTSHTVPNLTNGTEYTFQVRAVNLIGDGAPSAALDATPAPVPAQPTGFTAAPGDTQVALAWTDPSDSSITGWEVRYKVETAADYGDWTAILNSQADTTSHTVPNLTNGTEYTFQVRAVNLIGDGAPSAALDATPAPVPAQPTGFTAAPGDTQVALAWTDPSDSSITGWEVRYKVETAADYGDWTAILNSQADTTSHTVPNLTNGTEYTFQVRAVNLIGDGAPSAALDATPAPVPAQPTGFTAAPGDTQVALAWTDPSDSSITGWEVRYKVKTAADYGDWTAILNSQADTTSHTVPNLTNGTEYTFQVRAVNLIGDGTPSAALDATPAPVPAQPTGFTATPGDTQVALAWTDPSDSTITGWEVRYKVETAADYGDWTAILNSQADTTSHTVPNLTNGTEYTFQVRAVNLIGDGAPSAALDATPAPVPAQPTGFTAAPGDTQVALAWTDPSDSSITGWEVRYKVKTAADYGDWTAILNSQADTTSHTVPNLTNGTEYTFQVRAVNLIGDGTPSAALDATPAPVPAQPTGFTATPGDTQVALAWTDPSDSTITGWEVRYKVETAADYGDWTAILNSQADTTSHTVPNLTNGTEYTFQVRAVNLIGDGAPSAALDATPAPVPAQPTGFTAAPGDTQVALAWTDPSDSSITGWEVRYKVKTAADYGDWTAILNSQADTTSHTVPNLTNGTEYTFQVRAVNLIGDGAPSDEVSVTINDAPIAGDDAASVVRGGSVRIEADVLLANDADADGDILRITGIVGATGGTVTLTWNDDGTALIDFLFTHAADADAEEGTGFVYIVSDGRGGEVWGQVIITVTEPVPTIGGDTVGAVTTGGGVSKATGTLIVTIGPDPIDFQPQTDAPGTYGAFSIKPDGQWSYTLDRNKDATRALAVGVTRTDGFRVQTVDGFGTKVTIIVTGVNDAPAFERDPYVFELEENRIGPVELGKLTATDPDADDTLVYALSGDGKELFAIDAASGVVTYTGPGEDHETEPNIYELTVRATDDGGLSATAAVIVEILDINEAPAFEQERYEFELEENRIGPVELGTLTATDPDAGEPVVYALSGNGEELFEMDTTSGVLTYTGPGEDYETKPNVYELTVSATDDEGLSAEAGVTVTVTDEADATAQARLRRVNQAILPELSRTMVAGVVESVAERIEGAGPHAPAPGNGYTVAGHSGIGEALIANEEALNEGSMDWKRALAGSSFALRLGGGETLMGSLPGQATIWGEGDWRELEVGGETGPVKFEGDVRGARLGLDTRLRDDLLAGVALSWTQGAFDYTDRGGAGYRPTAGRHESRMTSVYPYVGWWPRPDVGLWGTVGYGEGEVEIDDEEAGAQSSDSALRAAALGGQVRLFSDDDLIQGGTTALTLKGEAWAGRFDLKDDGGRMRGMEVDVRRLRLGLEGEHARRLGDGSTLTPSLELGLRHDDGDGEVGRGVELGGGLTWSDPARGLTAGIHGRTLLAHHGDLEEWGVGGQVTFGPGVDGHGLSFSLEPSWGEAQDGLARLWEDELAAANDPLADDAGTAMRLDAEIGYGRSAVGGRGVLTPYSGLSLSGDGNRIWRLGQRLEIGPSLAVDLEVKRRERADDAPDHSFMLRATARW